MLVNITKSLRMLVLFAIPAAAAFLFRRQERGFGYINPAYGIWIAIRYYLTVQYGTQMFSLRRYLHLDNLKGDGYEDKTEQAAEGRGKGDGAGTIGTGTSEL